MLQIQTEAYGDIIDEMEPMFRDLSREADIYPEAVEPNVDNEQFVDMGDSVLVVTVRDDGELIGFNITVVLNDILFKHVVTAYNMFYYVKPEYRKQAVGQQMFEFTEKQLKGLGVQRSFMPRKLHLGGRQLFSDLGYTPVEVNYTKYLGD